MNYYVHAFVVCNDYYSVCDVYEIYDNNIWPRLIINNNSNTSHTLMIFLSAGTQVVYIILQMMWSYCILQNRNNFLTIFLSSHWSLLLATNVNEDVFLLAGCAGGLRKAGEYGVSARWSRRRKRLKTRPEPPTTSAVSLLLKFDIFIKIIIWNLFILFILFIYIILFFTI